MQSKPLIQSKTMWINGLAAAIAVAAGSLVESGLLNNELALAITSFTGAVAAGANALLRFLPGEQGRPK